jgi:DNA-binding transcriptional LysR family regulator
MRPPGYSARHLNNKTLEIILPQYQPKGFDIYAIVQSKRYLSYKARLFVKHLRDWFKQTDWSC